MPVRGAQPEKINKRGKYEKHLFLNCNQTVYHPENWCFKLEKNKYKRPSWYNVESDELGPAISTADVA